MAESLSEMKIVIKKTNGTEFNVTVKPCMTIKEVKDIIATEHGVPAEQQRLIYRGQVLKNGKTIEEERIDSEHALILSQFAVAKPPAQSVPVSSPQATTTNSVQPNTHRSVPTGESPSQQNPALGFGGMPDPEMMMNLLGAGAEGTNPGQGTGPGGISSIVQQLMGNPDLMRSLMSPEMMQMAAAQGPEMNRLFQGEQMNQHVQHLLQNPELLRSMMTPEMMTLAMQMQGSMRGGAGATAGVAPSTGGMGGAGVPGTGESTQPGMQGMAGNQDMGSMMANAQRMMQNNPEMQQMMTRLLGGGGGGNPMAPQSNLPPEQRFAVQLQQLEAMGFLEKTLNITALLETDGDVNLAIDRLSPLT